MINTQHCCVRADAAIDGYAALSIAAAFVALCYGGGFATMPAFATDVFGARNAGTIYGAMLTAWSMGAIAGTVLIAVVPYRSALLLIACMLALATALPVLFDSIYHRGVCVRPTRGADETGRAPWAAFGRAHAPARPVTPS